MQQEFSSTRTLLQQAISLLERIYNGNPPPGQLSFFPPPHAKLAFKLVLRAAVTDQTPTALITESFYCDQASMHMLLMRSHIDARMVLERSLDARGFDRLTQAAYELANAPLFFRPCAAPIIPTTQWLIHLAENCGLKTVVAEIGAPWKLADWEEPLNYFSTLTQVSVHLFSPSSNR